MFSTMVLDQKEDEESVVSTSQFGSTKNESDEDRREQELRRIVIKKEEKGTCTSLLADCSVKFHAS